VFTITYCIAYALTFRFGWQLVTYYPAIGRFSTGELPFATAGTPIYLYGWVATATLAALAVSALSLLVPERWTRHAWHGWSWLVPAAAALFCLYAVRIWLI
jgi:hypothetical protein